MRTRGWNAGPTTPRTWPSAAALSTLGARTVGCTADPYRRRRGPDGTGRVLTDDPSAFPNGLALGAADRLYGASLGDDAVETLVHDPEGMTVGSPTNIAFGGPDTQTLYIADLGLWRLTAVEIDARRRPSPPR